MQYIVMRSSGVYTIGLPFATGLKPPFSPDGNGVLLMMAIVPVPFMLFYFSERIRGLLYGYGQLLMIRQCSKVRLVSKEILRMAMLVILLVVLMACLYGGLPDSCWTTLPPKKCLQILAAYSLGLIMTVLVQFLGELYWESQYAMLAANLIFVGGLLVSDMFTAGDRCLPVNYLLYPNLCFAFKNGALDGGTTGLSYDMAIFTEGVLLLTLIVGILLCCRKKDIV